MRAAYLPASLDAAANMAEVITGAELAFLVRPFLTQGGSSSSSSSTSSTSGGGDSDGGSGSADHVVKVAHCRTHYSAVLLASGALLLLANNSSNSRPGSGVSPTSASAARPGSAAIRKVGPTASRLPSDGRPVVDVAAGEEHLVYCTADGSVFSCGFGNSHGQLGNGSIWTRYAPDIPKSNSASSGSNKRSAPGTTTAATITTITTTTTTAGAADGRSQLEAEEKEEEGEGNAENNLVIHTRSGGVFSVPKMSPATRIAGFGGHTSDGNNSTGTSVDTSFRQSPMTSRPPSVVRRASTHDTHSTTTTTATATTIPRQQQQHTMTTAGSTSTGYLASRAPPVLSAAPVPRVVIRIRAVACGAAHSLLLSDADNCVYGCGRGDHGQLGTAGRPLPLLQPSFRSIRLLFGLPIKQIAAAARHSLVLLRSGKLLVFGDNTCGQLGTGDTRRLTKPTAVRFNLPANGIIINYNADSNTGDKTDDASCGDGDGDGDDQKQQQQRRPRSQSKPGSGGGSTRTLMVNGTNVRQRHRPTSGGSGGMTAAVAASSTTSAAAAAAAAGGVSSPTGGGAGSSCSSSSTSSPFDFMRKLSALADATGEEGGTGEARLHPSYYTPRTRHDTDLTDAGSFNATNTHHHNSSNHHTTTTHAVAASACGGHASFMAASTSTAAAAVRRIDRLLDSRALQTLRAPYASTAATHFPLGVRRIDGEREEGQPTALSVWASDTTTIVLTADLEWLSCGLPLTRSWQQQQHDKAIDDGVATTHTTTTTNTTGGGGGSRYDGYGALGRHLESRRDAYRFGLMAWTPMLRTALRAIAGAATAAAAAAASTSGSDVSGENGAAAAVVVVIPDPATGGVAGVGAGQSYPTPSFSSSSSVAAAVGSAHRSALLPLFGGPLVECYCYPHATFVRLTAPATANTTVTTAITTTDASATVPAAAAATAVLLEVGSAAASAYEVALDATGGLAATSSGGGSGGAGSHVGVVGPPGSARQHTLPQPPQPQSGGDSPAALMHVVSLPHATTAAVLSCLGVGGGGGPTPTAAASAAVEEEEHEGQGAADCESFRMYVMAGEGRYAMPLRDSVAVM